MSGTSWVEVPVGSDAPRWLTVRTVRRVLVIVHTVTAFNRLNDILGVFDSDRRVQLVFTIPQASSIPGNIDKLLADMGAVVIPWSQATKTRFDLSISVHHSGQLHLVEAPLIALSHGIGYTKYLNRKQENRSVYGFGRESLVHNDVVIPAAIALSHHAQLKQLQSSTPAAVDRAVVTGDPCLDRIMAGLPDKQLYRRVLGARPGTTIVVVSSTWGPNSLLGRYPDLLDTLVAELSLDEYTVAAILHPNAWFGHGPRQIRCWLHDSLRAGLRLIPADRGWQHTLLAADVAVGDNGAVTGYAAAVGIPTLLASFPENDVVPGTAIETLGRLMPRLTTDEPLEPQIQAAIRTFRPESGAEVAALASSAPGRSSALLRKTFYRLMNLTEPSRPTVTEPFRPDEFTAEYVIPHATWVACTWEHGNNVRVRRWPADVVAGRARPPRTRDVHLVVHHDHPRRELRDNADIIILSAGSRSMDVNETLPDTLANRPGCAVVATIDPHGTCHVRHRAGWSVVVDPGSPVSTQQVELWASALYSLHEGVTDLPSTLTVRAGDMTIHATVRRRH